MGADSAPIMTRTGEHREAILERQRGQERAEVLAVRLTRLDRGKRHLALHARNDRRQGRAALAARGGGHDELTVDVFAVGLARDDVAVDGHACSLKQFGNLFVLEGTTLPRAKKSKTNSCKN